MSQSGTPTDQPESAVQPPAPAENATQSQSAPIPKDSPSASSPLHGSDNPGYGGANQTNSADGDHGAGGTDQTNSGGGNEGAGGTNHTSPEGGNDGAGGANQTNPTGGNEGVGATNQTISSGGDHGADATNQTNPDGGNDGANGANQTNSSDGKDKAGGGAYSAPHEQQANAKAMYFGKATYYTQDGNAGACGEKHSDSDYIVAIQSEMYNGGANCGKRVAVTRHSTNKTIICIAEDACPGCPTTQSLDLSVAAFNALGSPDEGVFDITWEVLD